MITVSWHPTLSNTILMEYTHPVLSWEEYDQANEQAYDLARKSGKPVYIIHNAGRTRMPAGNALVHLKKALRERPSNILGVIAVINNRIVSDIMNLTFKMVMGNIMTITSSLEEAEKKISHRQHPTG